MQKPDPQILRGLIPVSDAATKLLPAPAEVFCVGGAVRDALLGHNSSDRDYVVVGSTPQAMLDAGFTPVGKDFPVFLHPQSKDEYALARTERKSGKGYKGFVFNTAPDVTLIEDLSRRDLTINAMAVDQAGSLIDPFKGYADLESKIFRHVGQAFSEDPVRLLRLARFAARWPDFQIAPETENLLKTIVQNGEADALVPERVWQEVQTGLKEQKPGQMIRVLMDCGAWSAITKVPAVSAKCLKALDWCAQRGASLEVRFAVLVSENSEVLRHAFKCSKPAAEMAALLCQSQKMLDGVKKTLNAKSGSIEMLLDWLERVDGFRRNQRVSELLQAHLALDEISETQRLSLLSILEKMNSSSISSLVALAARKASEKNQNIEDSVRKVRLESLKEALAEVSA